MDNDIPNLEARGSNPLGIATFFRPRESLENCDLDSLRKGVPNYPPATVSSQRTDWTDFSRADRKTHVGVDRVFFYGLVAEQY